MLLYGALLVLAGLCEGSRVWPLSGTSTIDEHSSPFGPRLKASESYRYDWHRGIDLPADENTPMYAIEDGVVRIAGSHEAYSDGVIQITHSDTDVVYYSTYLHINSTDLVEGQSVSKGDVVGTTGVAVSGFPHLHFEIREGGLFQYNSVNPWNYLPRAASETRAVAVEGVWIEDDGSLTLSCSAPASQLDFNEAEVEVTDAEGVTSVTSYNFNSVNGQFTEGDYVSSLDEPDAVSGVVVSPATFTSGTEFAVWNFTFSAIVTAGSEGNAKCRDLVGREDTSAFSAADTASVVSNNGGTCRATNPTLLFALSFATVAFLTAFLFP